MVNGEIPYGIEEGGIEEAFAIWMGSIWKGVLISSNLGAFDQHE